MTHSLSLAIAIVLGGIGAFVALWYLIGMGIGIAQRGYNRIAPYRITTKVVEPPPLSGMRRPPYTWENWESRR
jgi:hypothetical protein